MSDLLYDKVVIVTGASSGIGRAIAIAGAQDKAKTVIVSDVTEQPSEGGGPTTTELKPWVSPHVLSAPMSPSTQKLRPWWSLLPSSAL